MNNEMSELITDLNSQLDKLNKDPAESHYRKRPRHLTTGKFTEQSSKSISPTFQKPFGVNSPPRRAERAELEVRI